MLDPYYEDMSGMPSFKSKMQSTSVVSHVEAESTDSGLTIRFLSFIEQHKLNEYALFVSNSLGGTSVTCSLLPGDQGIIRQNHITVTGHVCVFCRERINNVVIRCS